MSTLDLIVVGGGFWGSAMARYAERKGASWMLIDSREPGGASRNASGYFSPRWYKDRLASERAAETAEALGLSLALSRATLVPLDASSKPRGVVPDLYTFSRDALMVAPTLEARVTLLTANDRHVVARLSDDRFLLARAVYLAGGVWTDDLLRASGLPTTGVTRLAGSAAVFEQPWEAPPLWIQTNPYQHVAVRSWGSGLRVCATLERNAEAAPTARQKLLAAARKHVELLGEPRWEYGFRPVLKEGLTVKAVHPRVYVGTGGGRIGAIWSYAAAEEAFRCFERGAWR
jgi:glycine/D-amino acid oxidase-like deaminating enzyme